MQWYKHYIGDFQRDTGHLSLTERGAYRALLDHHYATEKPLPADPVALARLVGAQTKAERDAVPAVLTQFWTLTDEGWINARAQIEMGKTDARRETNRAVAQAREQARNVTGRTTNRATNRETNRLTIGVTKAQPLQTPDTREDQERGATAPSADKPPTDIDARLSQVTDDAIEAYNRLIAEPLSLPKALPVGIDKKRGWVRRSLRTIREVCRAAYGSERIEPRFWADYFATQAADDFIAGRTGRTGSHANWRPDFEYLLRPDVIAKAFERSAA